ncbi:aldehyde dehydrogenase (NAD+) [Fusarium tjaetaba]|uniref:Aldehyde dehydrogenase n=1 Tax=Fusarium tjaetaba TaxID=1567544 RepID=A0A8H5VLD3_9HYPO|nr:aldehyde dehydrogenase (NAD+) [Fusarium tjaetaba]KAF5625189.1 aldehyde dehydrogenase (NAD+) [Fusarium tjaetaba]
MASTTATAEGAPTTNIIKDFDSDLASCYNRLQETFSRGHTKLIPWRKWQLKQLWWMIEDNQGKILNALTDDLGRHEMESRASDLLGLKIDILEHIKHVEGWAATRPVPDAGFLFGRLGKARIRMEPIGVVLIIGAWNFPFLLTLQPVIAAVAAGCCVIIKPSELAMNSERVMADLVASYLDQSAIRLVTGGPEETTKILKYRFDHIFFTGSAKVARFITAAAAQNLTPTTLELGGQCPAIITKTANIDLSAKRIAAVKFQNAGQICLSVNHVFADPSIYDQFLARLEYWTRTFAATGQMCHIINERNRDRLVNMLHQSRGRVIYCGDNNNIKSNEKTHLDAVIVADVSPSDAIMSEELFGPICPVIKATMEQAVVITNNLPRPLAIYIFSSDKSEMDRLQDSTISGGVTINDATMHAGVPNAPFGGVGDSGMGFYHGKYGFLAFTHQRTVVELPAWLDKLPEGRSNEGSTGWLYIFIKIAFLAGSTLDRSFGLLLVLAG